MVSRDHGAPQHDDVAAMVVSYQPRASAGT